jgi:toxin CcdB
MNQFDVRKIKGANAAQALIVVLQHDALDTLGTVVVAPLLPLTKFRSSPRLHPLVDVEGQHYMIAVEMLFSIERKRIGEKVDTAVRSMDRIKNALDLVFLGF